MSRLKVIGLAAALALGLVMTGDGLGPCSARAQGSCASECRAAFGDCYKATNNRAACEAQMQRCLQGCIARR